MSLLIVLFKISTDLIQVILLIFIGLTSLVLTEPCHAKTCFMQYANNKDADQPKHPRSLISILVVRSLESIISIFLISKISSFSIASVVEQTGLSHAWLQPPEDRFSPQEAQSTELFSYVYMSPFYFRGAYFLLFTT